MRICVSCSAIILNVMRYLSKNEVADRLRFVESQTVFVLETTVKVNTANDFLMSQNGMVLFNSTCMCLQSIGETIRQIDDRTDGRLFALYPSTPWKKIIGMRNFLSHEYFSIDPQVIFATVKTRLHPMLEDVRKVLADVDSGLRDDVI